MYDGYVKRGLELCECPSYALWITTVLSHPLAIGGSVAGMTAIGGYYLLRKAVREVRGSGSGLEDKLR